MKKRFLHALLALGLVAGLFAGTLSTGFADGHEAFEEFPGGIFFPTVHDGATIDGYGTWYSNITVQNIENFRVFVEFSSYAGGTVHNTVTLQPRASATFPAAAVNGGVTTGPVVATAYWFPQDPGGLLGITEFPCEIEDTDTTTDEFSMTFVRGAGAADTQFLPDGQSNPTLVSVTDTDANDDLLYVEGVDYDVSTTADSITIDWSIGGTEPAEGAGYTVEYTAEIEEVLAADCAREPHIAGYAKQASPQAMTAQSTTSSAHIAVDGYNASPVADVAWGPQTEFSNLGFKLLGIPLGAFVGLQWDGHSYLPIVQNNSNWNTIINLSHIDGSPGANNTTVTIRFYEAFGPGEGAVNPPGTTVMLSPGDHATVNLSDFVGDEFVGSAWITSQFGIIANAERVKPLTDMLIVTESAPSLFDFTVEAADEFLPPAGIGLGFPELFEAYAPLVFSGHNGWNSGLSVVNIAEIENTVNVQIFNESGNTVLADTLTIPAKGQRYIYLPHLENDGEAVATAIGSAFASSILPFHMAVDQVKYDGPGQDAGQAMSYIATQSGAENIFFGEGDAGAPDDSWSRLAFPLVQKGNPATGLGDTSGLQFFNGTSDLFLGGGGDLQFRLFFFDAAGNFAPPTSASGIGAPMTLGTMEGGTVYTMNISQMSSGIPVSATAIVTGGLGVLYAVTNNVNYAVEGDGSVAWNAFNAWGQFRTWSGPWFGEGEENGNNGD